MRAARAFANFGGFVGGALTLLYAETAITAMSDSVQLGSIRAATDGEHATARLRNGKRAAVTVESKLQADALKLLARARPLSGAVIVIDVATGKLRALAQYTRAGAPSRNPLTTSVPAASVFKLVTTTALFEHSSVGPKTRVCFAGGNHQLKREHLVPPPRDKARCAPFGTALGYSRNAVYAQLAFEHLMRAQLLSVAERLGFNQVLPFDAPARVGHLELPYNDLQFARAAAGFIGSRLSPLGAAHLTYAIARRGMSSRIRLLQDPESELKSLGRIMSANTAWRLTRMMEVTVHSGTSLDAFTNDEGTSYLGDIRVAGKTGTLQEKEGAPTTSWFTGFAPSRNPRVIVTVMLQNGRVWRRRANEVARDMLRATFAKERGVSHPFNDTAK